jgi:hypothetical protein
MSTPREMRAGMPQAYVLSPTLFNMYISDAHQRPGVYLVLFADETKKGFVVRKLQRGLSSMETCCERWNIKINECKSQGNYFSRSRRSPEFHLTLNGRNIPFVNNVKYLGVSLIKMLHGDYT